MTIFLSILGFLLLVVLYDVTQKKHAILRNFPIVGHFRYWLETVGPELRQYIVTNNNEERPFSRHQRRWVYSASKKQNEYFGFGTEIDMEQASNHIILKHSAFPWRDPQEKHLGDYLYPIPCAKILGGTRKRRKAFRPQSIVNVSGMSFGSLSAQAVEALNRGCNLAGCLQDTGEGGVSKFHRKGGELIWQIGTGYFGCRDEKGKFSLERFKQVIAETPVRAIEIKMSQGAKPGLGGMLPGIKVSADIAEARGVPVGKDCFSPASHSSFSNVDGLLDFVEMLAEESGLPVGIKSAVGRMDFWQELTRLMAKGDRGVDFVTVDGGEGGTGAAPLAFSDHIALPFKIGFSRVYRQFLEAGLDKKVVFIGSGKLGFPETALLAIGLGCDMVHVAREPMLSIGCIQAQKCHTNHCPTGVATQNAWLSRGLDPKNKAVRLANYITTLRKEILRVSWACGYSHPAFITTDTFEVLDGRLRGHSLQETFDYQPGWGFPPKKIWRRYKR